MHSVTIILNMKAKVMIRNKMLSIKGYFYKIRPYLSNVINDLKAKDEWKI